MKKNESNPILGLVAIIVACMLSGLAGVYFEKILKNSSVSIWIRNIQLGFFGFIFAILGAYSNDFTNIQNKGFFFGYSKMVIINILIQASGGLLVSLVIKYADNILKGFATSLAIIVSCLMSTYIFGTVITSGFAFGTFLVILSIFSYSYVPKSNPTIIPMSIKAEETIVKVEK